MCEAVLVVAIAEDMERTWRCWEWGHGSSEGRCRGGNDLCERGERR